MVGVRPSVGRVPWCQSPFSRLRALPLAPSSARWLCQVLLRAPLSPSLPSGPRVRPSRPRPAASRKSRAGSPLFSFGSATEGSEFVTGSLGPAPIPAADVSAACGRRALHARRVDLLVSPLGWLALREPRGTVGVAGRGGPTLRRAGRACPGPVRRGWVSNCLFLVGLVSCLAGKVRLQDLARPSSGR